MFFHHLCHILVIRGRSLLKGITQRCGYQGAGIMEAILEVCLLLWIQTTPKSQCLKTTKSMSIVDWLRALALHHWQEVSLKESPTPHSTTAHVRKIKCSKSCFQSNLCSKQVSWLPLILRGQGRILLPGALDIELKILGEEHK